MPALISAVPTPIYDLETVTAAVRTHFARFSLGDRLGPEVPVVIKPNLVIRRRPEEFTTTHPTLVEAAILCLKEYGVTDITLAESPGGLYTEGALRTIYDGCGMTEVCRRHGITLNFDVTSKECHRPENRLVKTFPIISPVAHAAFFLEICKLKTHAMTGMSGAVKNLFGTIPGLTKPEFHWIPTVRLAVKRGLCTGTPAGYRVEGTVRPVRPFVFPDTKSLDFMSHCPKPLRKPFQWFTKHFLTSRPQIRTKDCIGCGKCAESCPAKTIRIENRKAVIHYENCIHCFCCHEMCPKRAIDVKQSILFHRSEEK